MKLWPSTHCPTCGATPGEMCRTRNGRGGRATRPHERRPLGSLKSVHKPIARQMDVLR